MQDSVSQKKELLFTAYKCPGELQHVWNVLQECPLPVLWGMTTAGVKVEAKRLLGVYLEGSRGMGRGEWT